jgi:hypothetical protein
MSDLLTRMTERTLGLAPSLQPKSTSTYESPPLLGDGLALAYAPDVIRNPDTGLAADLTGENPQTNTVVLPRSNVPAPIVVTAQPNLVISRLSHNLSGSSWQNALSPVTDPMTAPVTPTDSPTPEMTVAPAASPEVASLSIDSRSFTTANKPPLSGIPVDLDVQGSNLSTGSTPHPSPLPQGERGQETSLFAPAPLKGLGDEDFSMRSLLPTADLVPQSASPSAFTVVNSSFTSEQSELTITRENLTSSAPSPSPIESPVNLVTNVTQMPAAKQPNLPPTTISSDTIESQPRIPSRERLVTEISSISPVAASPQLVSIPDRKAIQTLVPITVRPIDRPSTTPVPQISSQATPPTIQVRIGRIEIRAVTTPPPAAPPKSRPSSSVPQLSLADYLKSRGSST